MNSQPRARQVTLVLSEGMAEWSVEGTRLSLEQPEGGAQSSQSSV